jgi:hypothetical protein
MDSRTEIEVKLQLYSCTARHSPACDGDNIGMASCSAVELLPASQEGRSSTELGQER